MYRRMKRSRLVEDVLRAMCIELGQSVRSGDMWQVRRAVLKWDALFQGLVAPVLYNKFK